MFDNEHAIQGSQCSSVPTYTLVVHNAALYRFGGARNNFLHVYYQFFYGVQCSVVSLSVCPRSLSVSVSVISCCFVKLRISSQSVFFSQILWTTSKIFLLPKITLHAASNFYNQQEYQSQFGCSYFSFFPHKHFIPVEVNNLSVPTLID